MLKSITTKNFRRLTDHTFAFGPGLQAIRGANEQGKTSLIEALAFALFSVKACRSPLAELVTWGQPDKALKVEAILESGGVEYSFTRSKAGAEVNYAGGRVVGQTEVTAFAERMLGASNGSVGKLMFASQGSIRGALADGPKATMELIEKLADFDVIDRVVDLVQANLLTGPAATAEDRVQRAEAAAAAAKAGAVAPDLTQQLREITACDATVARCNAELETVWTAKHTEAKAAYESAQQKQTLHDSAVLRVKQLNGDRLVQQQKMVEAQAEAKDVPAASEFDALQHQIDAAGKHVARYSVWQQLQKLQNAYPEVYWDEPRATLEASQEEASLTISRTSTERAAIEGELRALRPHLQTSGTCKACGQTLPDAAAIAKHVEDTRAKILALETRHAALEAPYNEARQDHIEGLKPLKAAQAYDDFAAAHPDLVRREDTAVPARLFWLGTPPGDGLPNVSTMKSALSALQVRKTAADKAQARADLLAAQVEQAEARIATITREIAAYEQGTQLPVLLADFERVAAQYNARVNGRVEAGYTKQRLEAEVKGAQAAYEVALAGVAQAEEQHRVAQAELDALHFNNALLKRVRQARPIIADKLWTIVLSAVSGYFSAMRGVKSVVTKDGTGFKVDGRPVEGLSGSTLDALGLAIRIALTRTFIPGTPLLVLDEPCAAMDVTRTQSTLGFLAATGFNQILMASHDEVSESVAANLITI